MKKSLVLGILMCIAVSLTRAQLPPVFDAARTQSARSTETVRKFLSPVAITWQSENAKTNIVNAQRLLKQGNGQADLSGTDVCVMKSDANGKAGLLFDFGKELHGGLQLVTDRSKSNKPVKIRIRFGESVSEAMSDIGAKGATNDHAMRDFIVELPWLGKLEIGNTGFRFVRIDLADDNAQLALKEVSTIFIFRDIPYLGSFNSSDPLLNEIWLTGAYTVHLNMQDYLWDGIKRDRLVWVGDMHPEVATISAVFGNNNVVPKSLDLSRDLTPLPQYMNGMITYSMWWVILHRDWYLHTGDLNYLKAQKDYLLKLLVHFASKVDSNNKENLHDGRRFLDWPSSANKKGVDAGMHAMLSITLEAGAELCSVLNDPATVKICDDAVKRLKKHVPETNASKQAAALLSLSGIIPADQANKEISIDGAKNFSTFYGYYMLEAKAKAGDYQGAIDNIREFWGAMLKLGATTFWEDFNLNWVPGASRIDEIVPEGKKDIHGDYGAYCYVGHRHSLSHGWASGPTPWLTTHVLGVKVVEPGCKVIKLEPHLGDLKFVEGTFPTPYGIVKIKHTKLANGQIKTDYAAPKGVKVIK
ncbi:hypothetical protein HDC92_003379 [Pedobacter sp. AK017]|uniref:alpha-L-rhamnosidase-related protein n=1 Tax=Pedobacter sp. AK017 TaxID=2723073 RepID=UPI0016181828|nr:alpha-L-rhamnosidase [Pedobacter sp. AK017]MBB5439683.1 hypothetical protein [Pedobacter sp. AK017]